MNMTNPFTDIDKAFQPFYDEPIVLTTKTSDKQTLFVFVCIDNTGDVLTDDVIDSDREDIIISVKKEDCAFAKKIQRGDKVSRPQLRKNYVVSSVVEDYSLGFIIKARQTACK